MLTDDQARALLHRAAATVEVSPAAPLTRGRRPRWPLVGVAAAVAVIVLGVALLGGRGQGGPAPAATPAATQAVTLSPGPTTVVPSVFGLTRDEATDRLERAGLTVAERPRIVCEAGDYALGTVPVTGEPVPSDREVTLTYADPDADLDCPQSQERRAQAWAFLAFLDGRGPLPRFAATVEIRTDSGDGSATTLTAAQAADPTRWQADDALAVIAGAMATDDAMMDVLGPGSDCAFYTGSDTSRDVLQILLSRYLSPEAGGCTPTITLRRVGGAITAVTLMTRYQIEFQDP